MRDEPLTPQMPGAIASVDDDRIQAIADGNVADLIDVLVELTDDELAALTVAELQGKNRSTAISAIEREQGHRQVALESPADDEPEPPAPIGDDRSYANVAASEIDPHALQRPVLSRDGWVLPVPAATPEG